MMTSWVIHHKGEKRPSAPKKMGIDCITWHRLAFSWVQGIKPFGYLPPENFVPIDRLYRSPDKKITKSYKAIITAVKG